MEMRNKMAKQKNEQGYFPFSSGIDLEALSLGINEIKKEIDNYSSPEDFIYVLNLFNEVNNEISIPQLKEIQLEKPLERLLSCAKFNTIYNLYNGVYEHIFKRAKYFGIPAEVLLNKGFPRCLEKVNFPENN